jgi:hypothetical protein
MFRLQGIDCFSDQVMGEDYQYNYYMVTHFLPPFTLLDKFTDEVREAIIASFAVYLFRTGSAAKMVRIAVEELLTVLNVPERNGKDSRMILYDRIGHLDARYTQYQAALMVIKFLGNAGSHKLTNISIRDVEHAYKVIWFITDDLFGDRRENETVSVQELNNRFGRPG